MASPCLGKALFCKDIPSPSPLQRVNNLTLSLPFVLPETVIEMFVGSNDEPLPLGLTLLYGVDKFANDAMPSELLQSIGGPVSWAPAMTKINEFNSSREATAALLAKPLNVSALNTGTLPAVNTSEFAVFGLKLMRNWTPSMENTLMSVPVARRQLRQSRNTRALALGPAPYFNATTAEGCRAAEPTSSTVVALTVTLTPPQVLLDAIGFNVRVAPG